MNLKTILFVSFLILFSSPLVSASYDPPGPPAVEVRVWIVSFTPLDDFDDGLNGISEISFTLDGSSDKGGVSYTAYFEYDYDLVSGKITLKNERGKEVMYMLYRERECWPIDDLELKLDAVDIDSPPVDPDDNLGSATVKIDSTLDKKYYNAIIPGKFIVKLYVEAVPVKEDADKCSYFFDQPDTMSSSIVTKSGGYIYDFELANMLEMWLKERGFANMIVIFQQCFGGGMADDIMEKLEGDIAILSASKHDEPAWGYTGPEVNPYTKEILKGLDKGSNVRETSKNAEKKDKLGPYGEKNYDGAKRKNVEHPQFVFSGKGEKISPGKKADGTQVKSKHALIFSGDNNAERHWKNIEAMYDLLKNKGFTDEDIIVLADSGKTPDHQYVDGPGTKEALWNAIKELSAKMNRSEQLVIYVTDHGNLETTEGALDKLIEDPVRQPIPPKTEVLKKDDMWVLDDSFLKILEVTDGNVPYISLLVEPLDEFGYFEVEPEEFFSNLILYFNDEKLMPDLIEPLYAFDENPDLDGYEVVFPVYDEDIIGEENLIELSFANQEYFTPFKVDMLMISTGSVPDRAFVFESLNETESGLPDKLTPEIEGSSIVFNVQDGFYVFSGNPELTEEVIDDLLSGDDLFYRIIKKKNWYNNNTDLVPGFVKKMAGNARINLEIETEDEGIMDIYMVTEKARIVDLQKGHLSDPTTKAKLDEKVVRKIIKSDNPVKVVKHAFKTGDIDYRGVGVKNQIKVGLMKIVFRLYIFFSDLMS